MSIFDNRQKILIVGPAWLGDMIMAQSLFKELHKIYNSPIIDVLAPDWCSNILARMPEVRKTITMTVGHGSLNIRERYSIGKKLRAENYLEAIILPNSLKSALIPFFANIKIRTGWLGEMRYGLLNNYTKLQKKQYPRMVERFVALAYSFKDHQSLNRIFYPELVISSDNIKSLKEKYQLKFNKPVVAMCPGAAFGSAKRWPKEYYADVANQLKSTWQIWLFGSKEDYAITSFIQNSTKGRCLNFAGDTTLEDAIDLISLSNIVLSNDSGLMHVSAALNKPLIAFYGPTPENFAPPLAKNTVSLYTDIECRPCRARECPLKHHLCMLEILPSNVIDHIRELVP